MDPHAGHFLGRRNGVLDQVPNDRAPRPNLYISTQLSKNTGKNRNCAFHMWKEDMESSPEPSELDRAQLHLSNPPLVFHDEDVDFFRRKVAMDPLHLSDAVAESVEPGPMEGSARSVKSEPLLSTSGLTASSPTLNDNHQQVPLIKIIASTPEPAMDADVSRSPLLPGEASSDLSTDEEWPLSDDTSWDLELPCSDLEMTGASFPHRETSLDVFIPQLLKNPAAVAFGAEDMEFLQASKRASYATWLDVRKVWRGLSISEAEEIAFWEDALRNCLTEMIGPELEKLKRYTPSSGSMSDPHDPGSNSNKSVTHDFQVNLREVAAKMCDIGADMLRMCGWISSFNSDMYDFVLDFINTRDCFAASDGPGVEQEEEGTDPEINTVSICTSTSSHGDLTASNTCSLATAEFVSHHCYIFFEDIEHYHYEGGEIIIKPRLVRPCHSPMKEKVMRWKFTLENPTNWLEWDDDLTAFRGNIPIFSEYKQRQSDWAGTVVHMGNSGTYSGIYTLRLVVKAAIVDEISDRVSFEQTIRTRLAIKVLPWHADVGAKFPKRIANSVDVRGDPELPASAQDLEDLKDYEIMAILRAHETFLQKTKSRSVSLDETDEETEQWSVDCLEDEIRADEQFEYEFDSNSFKRKGSVREEEMCLNTSGDPSDCIGASNTARREQVKDIENEVEGTYHGGAEHSDDRDQFGTALPYPQLIAQSLRDPKDESSSHNSKENQAFEAWRHFESLCLDPKNPPAYSKAKSGCRLTSPPDTTNEEVGHDQPTVFDPVVYQLALALGVDKEEQRAMFEYFSAFAKEKQTYKGRREGRLERILESLEEDVGRDESY
ncbi:MAG: hypothetical protein M1837_004192 [Sclerophora amabilis]|nr:MAG: hypothetical protein M1837_004192 [Sclerophora amabilis]